MGDELGIAPLRNRPGLGELVVVVVHQAVGIAEPALLRDFLAKKIEKAVTILLIEEDLLSRVAARGYVVKRAGKFQAQRASHASI